MKKKEKIEPEEAIQRAIKEYEKAKPHYNSMVKCEDAVTESYINLGVAATEGACMLLTKKGIKVGKKRRKFISQKLYELGKTDKKTKKISEDYTHIISHASWIEYFGLDELKEYIELTKKFVGNVRKIIGEEIR